MSDLKVEQMRLSEFKYRMLLLSREWELAAETTRSIHMKSLRRYYAAELRETINKASEHCDRMRWIEVE